MSKTDCVYIVARNLCSIRPVEVVSRAMRSVVVRDDGDEVRYHLAGNSYSVICETPADVAAFVRQKMKQDRMRIDSIKQAIHANNKLAIKWEAEAAKEEIEQ